MKLRLDSQVQVDSDGKLILPQEVILRYGLKPGAKVPINETLSGILLRQPVTHLKKVYFEPTNQCNLTCRSCIRNTWDEPLGQMADTTFDRAIDGLRAFSPPLTILFGGFGEPLSHPGIAEMVTKAKALGSNVELITNGTLLSENLSSQLIAAGLDVLWVSLDGATPESYADVRLGAVLPEVIANVARYRDMNLTYKGRLPHIGIIFVAMKRNIADLPAVMRLGMRLIADRFLITNVLPYTIEMCAELLYASVLGTITSSYSPLFPHLSLPKIEMNEITRDPLYRVIRTWQIANFDRDKVGDLSNYCPFIEGGSTAICWDGSLSPCLPLMHSHISFLQERKRFSRRYVIGNVAERSVSDLWNAPKYIALRERVQSFEFPPCTSCGGCHLSKTNEEDCFGNTFPTCGGCLWAQGVIQCP
jgi:MoaA/NifB/PqqE/SkfB family radical SAM enzyme